MRLLILGGTVFLGRHVVDAALARGHEVTIYTRGRHGTAPEGVEHVDRRPRRRHAAARPRVGRRDRHLGLRPRAGRRVGARSTSATTCSCPRCNAYPDWPDKPVDEDSPTWQDGEGYGPDKAAAERARPRRDGAVVRAGLIVGPHDNIFRLPWWVRRIAEGGDGARRRATRTGRCRSSTRATSRRSCSTSPSSASPAPSTAPARSGRRRWASCSTRAPGDAELRWIPDDKLEEAERRAVDGAPAVAAGALSRHVAHRDRARPRRPGCARARSPRPSQDICDMAGKRRRGASSTTGAPSTARRR